MKVSWREVQLPDLNVNDDFPDIPKEIYERRCHEAYTQSRCDWLIIYGDREHYANLAYLTGFDPRFEEAVLVIGKNGYKALLVGNEGFSYTSVAKPVLEIILCQSFSLMGQDREQSPSVTEIFRGIGIKKGDTVGIIGWKYLENEEWYGDLPGFFAPSMLVDCIKSLVGDPYAVLDRTRILMHPVKGTRARAEVEQIAAFEWMAERAAKAVLRIMRGIRPGMSEFEAVSKMGFSGEPLSVHLIFASGKDSIVGLRSPSSKTIVSGDGAVTAIGYWGGLVCRAGLVKKEDPDFIAGLAIPYFRGIAAWYESVGLGVKGGEVVDQVAGILGEGGLQSALTPGHLGGLDEWTHSPMRPGSQEEIASGMMFQCDIIPIPLPQGKALNCEDPLVIADETLRQKLEKRYPHVWARIQARQQFMRNELGIQIKDEVLPLSSMPAYFAPLWLSPANVLTMG